MSALLQVFADARGHRGEAVRARKLAEAAHGQLQSELLEIAALYDCLADGKDPDEMPTVMIKPALLPRPITISLFGGSRRFRAFWGS